MWFKFVIYLIILSNLFISYYYKGEGNILWCIVDVLNVEMKLVMIIMFYIVSSVFGLLLGNCLLGMFVFMYGEGNINKLYYVWNLLIIY